MCEHFEPPLRKSPAAHRVHALVVTMLIALVGLLFVFTFRFNPEISEIENRRLAAWPTFSSESLLNGQYARDIETYVSDHFPGRTWLTELAFAIRTYRGIDLGDRIIQVKGAETGFEDVSQWAGSTEATSESESAVTQADTLPDVKTESQTEAEPERLSKLNPEPKTKLDAELQVEPKAEIKVELQAELQAASKAETPTDEQLEPQKETDALPRQEKQAEIESISRHESQSASYSESQPASQAEPQSHTQSASQAELQAEAQAEAQAKSKVAPKTASIAQATQAKEVDPLPKKDHVESKPASTVQSPPAPVALPPKPATPVAPQVSNNQAKPLNVVGGVLLHDGQALFMFQGTDRGAQGYANAVNTWVELVAKKRPGMTTTVVVTPTSSHFYLPPAARARTTSEAKNLAAMRSALLPEVRFADVIAEMEGHQDQPLFYKSDHHWTGLGAYYAYRAWARASGVQPLDLSAFDKRSVPGVAGSFWSLTQAPELRHADKESYYYVPKTVTFDGTQYTGSQQRTPIPQPFFAEKSRGYIVFLGGDIPLLVSNTSAGTGRTALVVKNSYGNAFAPYLLPHFDRVVVLDYRYVSRNIQDIVDTFGVTDLVFVNATITANSGAHQERMRQVARGTSTAWLTEAEKRKIKQDQEAAAQAQSSAVSTSPSQ